MDVLGDGLFEISLEPSGKPFTFRAGQFALVYLEAKDGWHRNPFSIASSPKERNVRVTVKTLGEFTSQIPHLIEPGMPAIIGKDNGYFDYRKGTENQVWVAGGVGVTPILSWLRSAEAHHLPKQVGFFYTAEGKAPFESEIKTLISNLPNISLHLIDSSREPHLTGDSILKVVSAPPKDLSVFSCGPERRVDSISKSLGEQGARVANIHREYFNWR